MYFYSCPVDSDAGVIDRGDPFEGNLTLFEFLPKDFKLIAQFNVASIMNLEALLNEMDEYDEPLTQAKKVHWRECAVKIFEKMLVNYLRELGTLAAIKLTDTSNTIKNRGSTLRDIMISYNNRNNKSPERFIPIIFDMKGDTTAVNSLIEIDPTQQVSIEALWEMLMVEGNLDFFLFFYDIHFTNVVFS